MNKKRSYLLVVKVWNLLKLLIFALEFLPHLWTLSIHSTFFSFRFHLSKTAPISRGAHRGGTQYCSLSGGLLIKSTLPPYIQITNAGKNATIIPSVMESFALYSMHCNLSYLKNFITFETKLFRMNKEKCYSSSLSRKGIVSIFGVYRVIHLSCRILLSFYSLMPRDMDLKLIRS